MKKKKAAAKIKSTKVDKAEEEIKRWMHQFMGDETKKRFFTALIMALPDLTGNDMSNLNRTLIEVIGRTLVEERTKSLGGS